MFAIGIRQASAKPILHHFKMHSTNQRSPVQSLHRKMKRITCRGCCRQPLLVPFDSLAMAVAVTVAMAVTVIMTMVVTVTMAMVVIMTGRRSRRRGGGTMLILAGDGNVGRCNGTLHAPEVKMKKHV